MHISVVGLGKLGACLAACIAHRGFKVIGIDTDEKKVDKINCGQAPAREPNLQHYISKSKINLKASTDYSNTAKTDITFFVLPTPSTPDGNFTCDFVLEAVRLVAVEIKKINKDDHIFVINSTLTPTHTQKFIIPELKNILGNLKFSVVYNPEFIAMGNVINGLLNPDVIILGESDSYCGDILSQFYQKFKTNNASIQRMSIIDAELVKLFSNAYSTMKISFTNQLRIITSAIEGTNVKNILHALSKDSKIGTKCFSLGMSYGGPCLPRDNALLTWLAKNNNTQAYLSEASDHINQEIKQFFYKKVTEQIHKTDKVLILGIAYKTETHLTDESPGLFLAETLKNNGYDIRVHDYNAFIPGFIFIDDLTEETLRSFNCVVICLPYERYYKLPFSSNTKIIKAWEI